MYAPLPNTEPLPDERMAAYAQVLKDVLQAAGVEEPDLGGGTIVYTPEMELNDGSTVTVSGKDGGRRVTLYKGEGPLVSAVPDAVVTVLNLDSSGQEERGYPVTSRPVVAWGGTIFVNALISLDLYRVANIDDDEALAPLFNDLKAKTEDSPSI